jgi:hypothetical protein
MEPDGLYDASSRPTSTQVNTLITDIETILDAIKPEAEQTAKDVIIKDLAIEKLNILNNYRRAQGVNTIEPGTPTLQVRINDITPLMLRILNGSAGKTYPRIDIIPLR